MSDIPDFSNENTRATEERLGSFVYDEEEDKDLISKKPFKTNNGGVYYGQWSKSGLRHGRGTQLWSDGTKYVGNWKEDKVNGKGRLIHFNGDVYEGTWHNDKA